MLVIEYSGVLGKAGQGLVHSHTASCCYHSQFEDGLDDGVHFVGNGVLAEFILLEAAKAKSSMVVLLHQCIWCVQATSHQGHIIELAEGSAQCGSVGVCFFDCSVHCSKLLVLERGMCMGQLVLAGVVLVTNGRCFNV